MINEDSNEPHRQPLPELSVWTILRWALLTPAIGALLFAAVFAVLSRWDEFGLAAALFGFFFTADWILLQFHRHNEDLDLNEIINRPHAWIIWPAALFVVPVTVGLLTAPHSTAADYSRFSSVTVIVTRSDDACVNALVPVNNVLTPAHSCDPHGMRFDFMGETGDLIGADPVETLGVATSCSVWVNSDIQVVQSGFTNINCLGRLA